MRNRSHFLEIAAVTAALSLACPFAAADQSNAAEANTAAPSQQSEQSNTHQNTQQNVMSQQRFYDLRSKTVSARELMNATVESLGSPVGHVKDLVLNSQGTAVQYVLYGIPYPYVRSGAVAAKDGFVAYDHLDIQPGLGYHDFIRMAGAEPGKSPELLVLERDQARHRLASRIIGDPITFSGNKSRDVQDILINRKTGEITGYVVDKDPNAWFEQNPLVIPADKVKVSDSGKVTTTVEFASLEGIK